MLGIAVDIADAEGVDPAAAVAARRDGLEVADDLVALILLEELLSIVGIARFGARVDAVENLRPFLKIETEAREMPVPVRVFDGHLGARIDRLGRADDEVPADLVHQIEPELGPAAVSLGGDIGVILRRHKEIVVEDDFVEMARDPLHRLFGELPVGRIGVAKRAKRPVGRGVGERDAAGGAHPVVEEEFLHRFQQGLIRHDAIAMGLDVDLVHFQLGADPPPFGIQPPRFGKRVHDRDRNVDGHNEVLVLTLRWGRGSRSLGAGRAGKGQRERAGHEE